MELTYTVRGADGKEYGPATLEQLTGWARDGRVQAQHEIRRSDTGYWSPASSFSELQAAFGAAAGPASQYAAASPTTPATPATEAQMKSGASWFYWIAGLSLINTVSAFSGSDWRFIIGLGITQVFDAIGQEIQGVGRMIALFLDLVAAGVFILFGVLAHKRHTWAFVTGMVLFALDGGIFLLTQDWIGVGFHIFVLYCLFRGFKACRELKGT